MKKLFLSFLMALCLPFLVQAQTINEIDPDQAGTDMAEFVELLGTPGAPADGLVLVLFNGSDDASYDAIDLDGLFFDANGLLVINFPSNGIQNGADAIALYNGDATDFPTDTPVTTTNLLDAIVYGTNDADDTGLLTGLGETIQYNDDADTSLQDDGSGAFLSGVPTQGMANDTTPPTFDCPTEMVNFGDACDDGDVNTENDVIQSDCTCAGTAIVFDCPTEMVNFGDACDDLDANTTNDVIQSDCSCSGTVPSGSCPVAFINEFHYDNASTDMNEFIEIAVATGGDASSLVIDLYNDAGSSYSSYTLTATDLIGSDANYDYYVWYPSSIQNGAADGISLSCSADGSLIQLISYEGTLTAVDGPASGTVSTDVGVAEDSSTTATQSIQFDGTTWGVNCTATAGGTNDLSTCGAAPTFDCPTEMVNFGDACDDGDVNTENDVIQSDCTCAGTAIVFDCPTEMVNFGDACDDLDANTTNDVIQSDCSCSGTVPSGSCPVAFINEFHYDNASTDMNEFIEIAVATGGDASSLVIDLYNDAGSSYSSYTLTATDLIGSDANYDYYVWYPSSIQNGAADGISLSCSADGSLIQLISYEGTLTAVDGPASGTVSTDVGVAEDSSTTATQSIQFDGTTWGVNCTATAGGTNDLSTCGAAPTFDCPTEMVNFGDACDDGDVNTENDVIQSDCTCAGTAIVFDCPTEMVNFGDACDDLDANTTNDVIQSDCSCSGTVPSGSCPVAFINEFHYDNASTDMNEFIEIAVATGGDASSLVIDLYNDAGSSYSSYTLTATDLIGSDANYDYYVWYPSSIQNGAADGISLSCSADGSLIQLISYEGTLTAVDGPASGTVSTDVGVAEDSSTTATQSIQFDGTTWGVNCTATAGGTNDLSTCGAAPTFDCPTEMVNFGDACDDGDVNTENDVIQSDCTCAGTPVNPNCNSNSGNFPYQGGN